jgi:precorrin-8X/cobalt-precorrin-8 methylmutase
VFDLAVAIDWSAASVPRLGQDSIWTAVVDLRSGTLGTPRNHATRRRAEVWLQELLLAEPDASVLVAIDVALGYPAGTADAWDAGVPGADDPPWRRTWALIESLVRDDERNANNRFAVAAELNRRTGPGPGPFWGCPSARSDEHLSTVRAPGFPHLTDAGRSLAEFRASEETLRTCGLRLSSPWQLLGAGSVGSQSLVAIPMLERLLRHGVLGSRVAVWPFTTGAHPPEPRAGAVVVAEVWPSRHPVARVAGGCRDEAQVAAVCARIAAAQADGALAAAFDPQLTAELRGRVVHEEGWILDV